MKNVLAILVLLFSFGVVYADNQGTTGDGFTVISAEAAGYPGAIALGQVAEANIEDLFRHNKSDTMGVVQEPSKAVAKNEQAREVKYLYFPALCLVVLVELGIYVRSKSLFSITAVAVAAYATTFSLTVFSGFAVMFPVVATVLAAAIATFVAAGRAFEIVRSDDRAEKIQIAIVVALIAASAGFVSYYPLF